MKFSKFKTKGYKIFFSIILFNCFWLHFDFDIKNINWFSLLAIINLLNQCYFSGYDCVYSFIIFVSIFYWDPVFIVAL